MSIDGVPRYWGDETSGVLRPAIEAYFAGNEMSPDQIAAMRAYLRQWIDAPVWVGPHVDTLRASIDDLYSRPAITAWLSVASSAGIEPL